MKKLALLSLMFSLGLPASFAHSHQQTEACVCSKECKENCSKGKTEACDCQACGCQEKKSCH
jgi:hypothetical protein